MLFVKIFFKKVNLKKSTIKRISEVNFIKIFEKIYENSDKNHRDFN